VYATCLFCKNALGRNQALEHFPVGRRLAYDQIRGRLWVVCHRCARWNLSPLETRWDAIEEAERAFRATRRRIATDNIALGRLPGGLELVRIGVPPRLELATWRYGDQFGRRRRKYIAYSGLGLAATAVPFLGQLGLGALLPLTKHDTWSAALVPAHGALEWYLRVHHRVPDPEDPRRRPFLSVQVAEPARLRGVAAQRALAALLPYANATGGSARRVRQAVAVIESSASLNQLVYSAAASNDARAMVQASYLTRLPGPIRLALEMAVHEDDERRAMEGELAVLEERWREAEEIAAIADALMVPAHTEARLEALRRRKD
jgi:hypothetical protein